MLLPETLNEGFGVVRTLVRDSTDAPQASGAETFLDSDNTVGKDAGSNQSTVDTLLVRPSSSTPVSVSPPTAEWPRAWDWCLQHASGEVDPDQQMMWCCSCRNTVRSAWKYSTGQTKRCRRAQDGGWHMIGLTTHPFGGKGYQMYLDGALVADMAANGSYTSPCPAHLRLTGRLKRLQLAANSLRVILRKSRLSRLCSMLGCATRRSSCECP